ncbi:pumilio-family RNA-binding repeat protein [Grosmannia clavigera kw1407]|uniref:Pumilio-family RNA-binding repeat protein n=1 Tax=Grosmannia clavigera (strain kw1407 / UAMH 11150) TaxID=655863 RepID=F0XTH7_GROCL|nr:pumilio-family RNA-binding repeat protein [Grosmannia clavigera kw1407]EFW98751.1 pumilio-family RNA-binding repeat protein [Grosmannia clavigera kw1407]
MSVPRPRLLDLMKIQCKIFATTFNPEGVRMGNKVLRQRLRGSALAAYYPRRVVTFKDLQRGFGPDLIADDELDADRLESNAGLRARGKGQTKRRGTAAVAPTGSPRQRRQSGTKGIGQDENVLRNSEDASMQSSQDSFGNLRKGLVTLKTAKLANQKGPNPGYDSGTSSSVYPMDTLLAKLSEQEAAIREQNDSMKKKAEEEAVYSRMSETQSVCISGPIPGTADGFNGPSDMMSGSTSIITDGDPATSEELLRLKLELAQAQVKITRLDHELAHSRFAKSDNSNMISLTMPEPDYPTLPRFDQPVSRSTGAIAAMSATKPLYSRDNIWLLPEDGRSDTVEPSTAGTIGRSRGVWRNDPKPAVFQHPFATAPPSIPMSDSLPTQPASIWPPVRPSNPSFMESSSQIFGDSSTAIDDGPSGRLTPDSDVLLRPPSRRRGSRLDTHMVSNQGFGGYGTFNMGQMQYDSSNEFSSGGSSQILNAGMFPQYQQQPIGTPLSPHATEFSAGTGPPWKNENSLSENPTFVPTTEPLNYRRLLDRNVNCNWKYIVDKIVCNNDQQASIFLQQKLKVGTTDQKYDIVEAIVSQAYPLMINRFGNFLVQRCFEHGAPEQIVKIAEAIRGNTLNLSMDPFGCHVVQKAFDSVTEDYKAIMVHELLRRIPETVIHRYACHVWQKLFELRWNDSPPQIMKYVNEALCGMWHEVALGETGSLVVQNIFENCLEEDKRPCIEEVLGNIDVVAHGQFGNWCIQHICEHGAPNDRGRAIDHVVHYAAEYSMDQFASKVVEKCLKIGGAEFLGRYLDRVCEGRVDRPRIPLIDIASDHTERLSQHTSGSTWYRSEDRSLDPESACSARIQPLQLGLVQE